MRRIHEEKTQLFTIWHVRVGIRRSDQDFGSAHMPFGRARRPIGRMRMHLTEREWPLAEADGFWLNHVDSGAKLVVWPRVVTIRARPTLSWLSVCVAAQEGAHLVCSGPTWPNGCSHIRALAPRA